ncbi:glycosyltransferase family 4 protein [Athalassotoga saccharophila]|uniref:glycosyltransferase family 4 protein n=1 Tax=Athalassotoga saccharophila TaxID=1441386 RepID=UPI00137B151F|nr:glycosyltransferase family 1 protein [Athalassotoga saccharophila]BBJ28324.1 mannosylfructose-phosphate synthase [Athalassotoga saccharophila]
MNKILVDASVVSDLNTYFTGIGWYTFNILKNVQPDKRKFITLFNPYDIKPWDFNGTYNTYNLNINRKLGTLRFFAFGGFKINKLGHNVYWAPNFVIPRFISSNTKCIVTVHDLTPFKHTDDSIMITNFEQKIKNDFFISNIKNSIKRADIVTSVSQSSANEIKDFFKLKNIEVVTPAYDKTLFKPIINSKELFYNKYKLDKRFILIGNMKYPRKNFNFVIEAFKKVKIEGLLCVFGTLTNEQVEFAQRELGDKFKHLGYVDEKDLPMIYSAANAFVAPSKMEGFDMPPLEARACGTKVIASDIPVHREVLENEAEYFMLNDLEKLSKLISDVFSVDKIIEPSKIIEKYDWKHSADKMIKIFEGDNI